MNAKSFLILYSKKKYQTYKQQFNAYKYLKTLR